MIRQGALITGSLDQTIKTWNLDLSHNAHQVMKTPPAYSNQITSAVRPFSGHSFFRRVRYRQENRHLSCRSAAHAIFTILQS